MNNLSSKRDNKYKEQEEYRKLFDQNSQREITNELAYKKRFEDFDKKESGKIQKYYEICHDNDMKRDEDIRKIAGGDGKSYYDYYDTREKHKQQKAKELKDNCYQSMRTTIDKNYKNIGETSRKRQEEAKRSADELQKYLLEVKLKKGDRKQKNEYRSILESQIKMKSQPSKFKINDFDVNNSELGNNKNGNSELYMIPGINSVNPYANNQNKGQAALGEHYSKMKGYINSHEVSRIYREMASITFV